MHYNIALIEDDNTEASILVNYFQQYSNSNNESKNDFDIKHFVDGTTFLSEYHPIYDLVILDINLPKINGIEVASRLRQIDKNVSIVFVTSMMQYATKGYDVDALDYIIKPVKYPAFIRMIKKALIRCELSKKNELLITMSDGIQRIALSHIKYIEIMNHDLIYHTIDGNFKGSGTLSDIEKKLDTSIFIRCYRCYIINLAFLHRIQGYTAMVDQENLPISRSKRNVLIDALNNFLGGCI